ncbi:MAG: dihydropteroate synthase [Pseudomonadota bacterium]|nr:dihydropteroate synthase [Pseudomonadota bacterium]MDO7711858.1 dihydropteroate synthase [Pseudomonadota bacterium]
MILNCAGKLLDLTHPQVMGILNVTPDSFSDGGEFIATDAALAQARKMVADGAGIIDVGGESTRPGATLVSVEEEIARVVPVIEAIRSELDIPISIDTSKPEVMRAAINAGAGLINDVCALQVEGAMQAAVDCNVPVCLMHSQGNPQTMQNDPQYNNVVTDVIAFLLERTAACEQAGIARDLLILDPGFGFGKRANHNLLLMKHLSKLIELGLPVLVGVSRKSMIGSLLKVSVEERLAASLSLAAISVWQGAKIIRSHDVLETVQAIMMCDYVMKVNGIE